MSKIKSRTAGKAGNSTPQGQIPASRRAARTVGSTERGKDCKPVRTTAGKAKDSKPQKIQRFKAGPAGRGPRINGPICRAGRKAAGGGDESAARVEADNEQPVKQGILSQEPSSNL